MSRIDELIHELCPEGVRHVALEAIAKTVPGLTGKSKRDFTDGNARYVTYKNVFANLAIADLPADFVVVKEGERQNELHLGDVVITGSSENFDDVGMSAVVTREPSESLYLNSFCFALRFHDAELLPEFSKYLFRSEAVRSQIRKSASGVTRINISRPRLMRARIPVPPLDVQREIVRVLNQFTELEGALKAELELRRQQRKVLAINFTVAARDEIDTSIKSDRVRLGAIAREAVEPVKVLPDQSYVSLGVKWNGEGVLVRESRLGDSIKAATLYRARGGQLIYNRMFVVEGSIALVPKACDGAVVSSEFPLFDLDTSRVEPEWLVQHLCDPYMLKRIEGEVTGTERGSMKSRRRWKADQFTNFEIDLPSLARQQEIVRVLRSSSALITSLEDELSARRKQYEYYRDRILTFKELAE